jgi:hypothetical protein
VARKKKKAHRWRRTLLIFILTPLAVWCLAFLIWLFWYDVAGVIMPGKTATRQGTTASRNGERAKSRELQGAKPVQENIPDEDRKKLDEILKRR